MSGDPSWERLWELFHAARSMTEAERGPFLAQASGGDSDLQKKIERLLERESGGGLLDRPLDGADPDDAPSETDELCGTWLGRYRLDEVLGTGGMGVVYAAHQEEPVRRDVALKLVRSALAGEEVLRRFAAERDVLALMTHRSIARVLDAGSSPDGLPYFVMERVDGRPITRFCDEERLTTRERLELFLEVCGAVQHAHQKGIVHRDLKPSNILVSMENERPSPRVIDFGIAKALDPDVIAPSGETALGTLLGTPEYMSPEQATLGGLAPDTRSDLYSLAVVLYEMLTGTRPFEAVETRTTDLEALRRAIREEDPERPSSRLARLDPERARSIAASRREDLPRIRRRLREDLDWILLRALDKDRERRYDSVGELAADIERHLRDEPVLAGPPSVRYRAKKFWRRHTAGVLAAGLSLLFLVALVVATAMQARRIAAERDRANREAQRATEEAETAQQVSDFLVDLFRVSIPNESLGSTITAREILDRGAERIRTELADRPVVQARLMDTIATVYRHLALLEPALELHREALTIREKELGPLDPEVGNSLEGLARTYKDLGDLDAAREAAERSLTVREAAYGDEHPAVAASLYVLAVIDLHLGHYAEARKEAERSAAIMETAYGPNDPRVAEGLAWAAQALGHLGGYAEGRDLAARALKIEEAAYGHDHPKILPTLNGLAILLWQMQSYEEARPLFERALAIWERIYGADHPDTASGHNNLGRLLTDLGDYEEARVHLERSLAIREKTLGPDHPDTATSILNLARLLGLMDKTDEAVLLYERGLRIREERLGSDHPLVVMSLEGFSEVLRRTGNEECAAAYETRAAAIRAKAAKREYNARR